MVVPPYIPPHSWSPRRWRDLVSGYCALYKSPQCDSLACGYIWCILSDVIVRLSTLVWVYTSNKSTTNMSGNDFVSLHFTIYFIAQKMDELDIWWLSPQIRVNSFQAKSLLILTSSAPTGCISTPKCYPSPHQSCWCRMDLPDGCNFTLGSTWLVKIVSDLLFLINFS